MSCFFLVSLKVIAILSDQSSCGLRYITDIYHGNINSFWDPSECFRERTGERVSRAYRQQWWSYLSLHQELPPLTLSYQSVQGCYNTMAPTRWLINNRLCLRVQEGKQSKIDTPLSVSNLLSRQRHVKSHSGLFNESTNSLHKALPSWCNCLPPHSATS